MWIACYLRRETATGQAVIGQGGGPYKVTTTQHPTLALTAMIDIRVQAEPFDIAAEQEDLWRGRPGVGALVTFVGLMRDMNQGDRVSRMLLEHYPGMTEKALIAIAEEADSRWDLQGIRILHRVGDLRPQDPIVLVAVTSAHRGKAFRACEFLIDYLKTRAPFWKKEFTAKGERWLDSRATDKAAAGRW